MIPTAGPRLSGRVALITGAARGQGRTHAETLAAHGADIIALDICAEIDGVELPYPLATVADLESTAAAVRARGRRVFTRVVDVRDAAALETAIGDGVAQLGRLDVVCANAGIFTFGAGVTELDPATWDAVLDVNAKGAWLTCRAAAAHLIAAGGGSIVLTSSAAALTGTPNVLAYTASKHALTGVMRTLAVELGPHGIRVNTVHPCSVDTAMVRNDRLYRLFRPDLDAPGFDDVTPVMKARNPLPHGHVEAQDVTNAVLFLASDEARFVTGTELKVDLGATVA